MQSRETQPSADPSERSPAPLPLDARRARILIVDDESGPRESIRLSLENMYDCQTAEDGFKGLEVLETFSPDMVILDINMPKMDGIETLRRIREKDADVEVMLLTAYGSLKTAQKAIRYSVFDYLEKPFDLHELRSTVAHALDRRRQRMQLEVHYDDLEHLLSRLKRDLPNFDRLARIGRLSAGIMHEMKNPLTVILGYTQMLTERLRKEREEQGVSPSEETTRYLSIIEQETIRCTQIARQLLSYSRTPSAERQCTTLYELVTNIRSLIQPQCSVNDVVLTAEPPVESVLLELNVGQLHDVLLNLCMNALEAMSGPGALTIMGRLVRKDAPELDDMTEAERQFLAGTEAEQFGAIEVRDSGCGIPPEALPHVFEPFFTTKEKNSGTGLGLAMCKERVEQHGGMINVVRTSEAGTTFRLLLPAAQREHLCRPAPGAPQTP